MLPCRVPHLMKLKSPILKRIYHVTSAVTQQCNETGLTLVHRSMPLLGGCVGSDDNKAKHIISQLVQSLALILDSLKHEAMPSQSALLLIRHCVVSRLSYLCRVTHSDIIREALVALDQHILNTLSHKFQLPEIDMIQPHTTHMVRLPIKLGGLGIPSLADTSHLRFLHPFVLPCLLRRFDGCGLGAVRRCCRVHNRHVNIDDGLEARAEVSIASGRRLFPFTSRTGSSLDASNPASCASRSSSVFNTELCRRMLSRVMFWHAW